MTIFGTDIASFQQGINLSEVKSQGFDFVFAKVSQGSNYVDPDWPTYRKGAVEAGLILAGYHYLDTSDVNAQAKLFVDNLGAGVPAMIDFEAGGGDETNFWNFVRAVNALGVQIALSYEPHWYAQQIGSPNLAQLPNVISSSYVNGTGYASALYPGDTSPLWSPYEGATPAILQFSSTALIAGMTVDADAYRGTTDELINLLGGASTVNGPLLSTQGASVMTTPDPFLDAEFTDAYGNQIRVRDALMWICYHADVTVDQLGGPGSRATGNPIQMTTWPQLGGNTIVNALALIGEKLGIPNFQWPLPPVAVGTGPSSPTV